MRSKLAILALAAALAASGQQPNRLNSRSMMHITLPDDSPLAVLSADWGESVATPRGSAILLDLRTSLTLRNIGRQRIKGVSLLVLAQEAAPGGKASVTVPSLDVGPGEAFPVKLDLRLLRPQSPSEGALVEISLDGVLYDDLGFYGPNRLNSRRSMTMWELEARRDRKYLKNVLDNAGTEGLRRHLTEVQARLSERPKLNVQVARGRTTSADAGARMSFAFLRMPGEPVHAIQGAARVGDSEARSPELEIRNQSRLPVKYLEIGWLVESRDGDEFFAGTVPADVNLASGATTRVQQDAVLKLTQRNGSPVPITAMTGFVNHVEFADGSMWIPQRQSLELDRLKKTLHPSPEEQRLSDLARRKGIQSVVEELRKH
ncbi:MAG: hypothetical protein JNK48_16325 [Bryobacterales bacterium]|nr:hypothetical protein [Bryobacterales bacterium]